MFYSCMINNRNQPLLCPEEVPLLPITVCCPVRGLPKKGGGCHLPNNGLRGFLAGGWRPGAMWWLAGVRGAGQRWCENKISSVLGLASHLADLEDWTSEDFILKISNLTKESLGTMPAPQDVVAFMWRHASKGEGVNFGCAWYANYVTGYSRIWTIYQTCNISNSL